MISTHRYTQALIFIIYISLGLYLLIFNDQKLKIRTFSDTSYLDCDIDGDGDDTTCKFVYGSKYFSWADIQVLAGVSAFFCAIIAMLNVYQKWILLDTPHGSLNIVRYIDSIIVNPCFILLIASIIGFRNITTLGLIFTTQFTLECMWYCDDFLWTRHIDSALRFSELIKPNAIPSMKILSLIPLGLMWFCIIYKILSFLDVTSDLPGFMLGGIAFGTFYFLVFQVLFQVWITYTLRTTHPKNLVDFFEFSEGIWQLATISFRLLILGSIGALGGIYTIVY